MSPHLLTRWVSRLLGLTLASWATVCVGVHRLSLRLPYLGVFPFTLLHLPLDFIRVSSLRPTYPSVPFAPICTHRSTLDLITVLSEFPCLWLALVPDVPEAEQGCAWNFVSNFCPGRGLNLGTGSLVATNVTTGLQRTLFSRIKRSSRIF